MSTDSNRCGYVYKWTNYVKGYKKRWFVLQDGYLSYYRNQKEMSHTCRGTINIANASIQSTDNLHFVICCSGSQTFHLRSLSEQEQKKWLDTLRLAKSKAQSLQQDASNSDAENQEPEEQVEHLLHDLTQRLTSLKKCHETFDKKCDDLSRAITETDFSPVPVNSTSDSVPMNVDKSRFAGLSERANITKISARALIKAVNDYHNAAGNAVKKMQSLFELDKDRMRSLEQMVEDLAKQHSNLEKKVRHSQHEADEEDSDDSFYDAGEVWFDAGANSEVSSFKPPNVSRLDESDLDNDTSTGMVNPVKTRTKAKGSSNRPGSPVITAVIPIRAPMKRRIEIPPKPKISINLWSIVKNCIGKDLSRIPMPVNFSEPLSMLQRLTEDFEYSLCLDQAAACKSSIDAMAYVAAFTVSSYASTLHRVNKPFNPLLGETYECDRTDDLGWRSVAEQISHHPPLAALHCESKHWYCWQDFTMATKFRGKYLQIEPLGSAHLILRKNGHHYVWRKVQSTVHNIIVGKLWIDNSGEMEIMNYTTGDRCRLCFKAYSYFSSDVPRRVTGTISNGNEQVVYTLNGTWDAFMEGMPVSSIGGDPSNNAGSNAKMSTVDKSGGCGGAVPTRLWEVTPLPPNAEPMYNFTPFTLTLNQPETGVAPTDSRLRPDQRLMENGLWDEANQEKLRLEHQQRERRKKAGDKFNDEENNVESDWYNPVWFARHVDSDSGIKTVKFNGKYWQCKDSQDWSMCPSIF